MAVPDVDRLQRRQRQQLRNGRVRYPVAPSQPHLEVIMAYAAMALFRCGLCNHGWSSSATAESVVPSHQRSRNFARVGVLGIVTYGYNGNVGRLSSTVVNEEYGHVQGTLVSNRVPPETLETRH